MENILPIKPNLRYLTFDDRKLMLLGIPILSWIVPLLFFGIDRAFYFSIVKQQFFETVSFTTTLWVFSRELMIYMRKRYSRYQDTFRRLGIQMAIAILGIPILSWIVDFFIKIVYQIINAHDLYEPKFLQGLFMKYFLTLTLIILYEAIYFFHKYREAILDKEQIRQAHIQAQLDNLRNQINPHFLFNSLNTLMNLIPTKPEHAMNYLSKLSKFYRYVVSNREASLVPLKTEMDNVQIYVDLLKERFHDSINIQLLQVGNVNKKIIPLCLQLLIENAVKHNIVSKKKPLSISVSLIENGDFIEVKNNIQKKIQEANSTGIGLKNIGKRVDFFTNEPLKIYTKEGCFHVAVPLI